MDTSTIVWIVVVVVALLILAAVLGMVMSKKKKEHDRTRASELREQATAQSTGVQQREADVRETAAQAQRARAEAEQKQAEAQRLDAQAQDKQSTATEYRTQREENMRQADEIDPDVDTSTGATTTDKSGDVEGQRYDEHGAPIRRDGSHTDVDSDSGTQRT